MKFLLLIIVLKCIAIALSTNPILTGWKTYSGTTATWGGTSYKTDITGIYYTSTYVYVTGQGIPSYSIGPWQANPNSPSGQSWVYQFPLTPSVGAGTSNLITSLGQTGAWANGMAIYGPWDGYTYSGVWHRNALIFEGISFDQCYGHPDGSGVYHNHVVPTCLYNLNNSAVHSPIVGWSFDGYPIYGPYGYSNATNANSAIKLMVSGYATNAAMTNRNSLGNGTALSAANYGPSINTTYPLGSFIEDFVWAAANGDLDANNGRWCVTPEYPSGTYAYFTTTTSSLYPTFPFVFGKTYYGTNVSPNGKGISVPSGVTTYFSNTNNIEPQKFFLMISIVLALVSSKLFF